MARTRAPLPVTARMRMQRALTVAAALAIVLVGAWLVSVWHLPL